MEVSDLIRKKNGKQATEMNRARENDTERRGGHGWHTERPETSISIIMKQNQPFRPV